MRVLTARRRTQSRSDLLSIRGSSLMPTYTQISGTFWRSPDAVFCEGHKLKLDPERTRVYFNTWATDGRRIYRWTGEVRAVDPKTFKALNNLYAKDSKTCLAGPKRISGADPKTFAVLDSGLGQTMAGLGENSEDGFARDRRYVYHNGNRVTGADPKSFVALPNSFGRDKGGVFYQHYRLQGANPQRWRLVAGLYSQDDEQVFYENRPVRRANPQHFTALNPGPPYYAYDGANFFCNSRVSSAQEYADDLEQLAERAAEIAMLRSGKWEQLRHAEMWPWRSPAEKEA
jgi:hypothetical protein